MPHSLAAIRHCLASLDGFWEHWGFELWKQDSFVGVSRRQRFVKKGLLGPIAEYQALDYIVWESGSGEDRENFWNRLRPMENIMTQRFLFLVEIPWDRRRIKSFFAGLKGYAEFYAYLPTKDGGLGTKDIPDLTALVDMGIRLSVTGQAAHR